MPLFRLTALALLTAAALLPQASYAADNIEFIEKNLFKNSSARDVVSTYDFQEIAAVDLNSDSLDEFILKDGVFKVLAQSNGKIIEIGEIDAVKIMLSYKHSHGVRDILAFSSADNDFEYDVYRWDIDKLRYTHKSQDRTGDKI